MFWPPMMHKSRTRRITYEFSPDLRLQCTGLYGLHTIQRGAKTVEMVDREAYLLLFVSTASYPKRYEDVQLRLTSTCFASDLWDSGHFHAEVKAEIWIC